TARPRQRRVPGFRNRGILTRPASEGRPASHGGCMRHVTPTVVLTLGLVVLPLVAPPLMSAPQTPPPGKPAPEASTPATKPTRKPEPALPAPGLPAPARTKAAFDSLVDQSLAE